MYSNTLTQIHTMHPHTPFFIRHNKQRIKKITGWYMSNKLTINFEKTNAILLSNSLNAQNDCPDVFFKLGESTRKIERLEETDLVRFLGI